MKLPYQKELLLSLIVLSLFVLLQYLPDSQQNSDQIIFEMTTKQWEFEPNQIIVEQGQTVVIKLQSTDVPHGFAINEYNIYTFVPAGQTVDISFVATETGVFEIFCNIFCGEGHSCLLYTSPSPRDQRGSGMAG